MAEFKWYGTNPDAPPPIEYILHVLREDGMTHDDMVRANEMLKRESSEMLLVIINEFMDMWAEGLQSNDSALVFIAHTGISTFSDMNPEAEECDNMIPDSNIVRLAAVHYAMSEYTKLVVRDSTEEDFVDSYLAARMTPIYRRVEKHMNKMRDRVLAELGIDDVQMLKARWVDNLRKGKRS